MSESKRPISPGRRRLFALIVFSLPFLLLGLLEGGLRLVGFGEPYALFVPVAEAPGYLQANEHIVRRFVGYDQKARLLSIRPVAFRRDKQPGTYRIVLQGGSSAAGFPYTYTASPAGMLQQRLQRTFPERRIEVITTAVSAVSSHMLRDFVGEIIAQHPDAVLVYAGHNEYLGLQGVSSGEMEGSRAILTRATMRLRAWSRLFQFVDGATVWLATKLFARGRAQHTLMATAAQQPTVPYDSPAFHRGIEVYRDNLTAMLARYREAGIPVLVATVASNLRDQAPFMSEHAPGADVAAWQQRFDAGQQALAAGDAVAALVAFDAAVAIDDLAADGHFARAKALDRLGRYVEARAAYVAAKERDTLRFRAPEAINAVIREVAAQQGAQLVEVEDALIAEAANGIIGHDLMLEHLHPNLRGYFVLADAFYEALRESNMIGPWQAPIPRDVAWREIPVTEVESLFGKYLFNRLKNDWPFVDTAENTYQPPAPTNRVEQLAHDFYEGRLDWLAAHRALLRHYRAVGNRREAAKVAVLLAEAFPYAERDQAGAAAALIEAGRPLAGVFLDRAVDLAEPDVRADLLVAKNALEAEDPKTALRQLLALESKAN